MQARCFRVLTLLILAATSALADPPAPAPTPLPPDHAQRLERGKDLFQTRVRQTLVDNCVRCHGGDKVRGGLDLSTREGLLKGGDSGPVVTLWKGKESRLYQVSAHLAEPHMPNPPGSPPLPAERLAELTRWIDDGAPYDKPLLAKADGPKKPMVVTDEDRRFWSFLPLTRPAVPAVKNKTWARTPIDRFILARLEAKGLTPNPMLEKRRLLRRVTFDLTGLPPTPAEVEAFVNDPAADAYTKVVDRLLASPRYGERWARHWLDLARFAESHGFEHDYDRPTAYPYRDFVIKAFNQDLPYNTFVAWQIAGDELAPDDPLAMTATGFLGAGVHSTQITINQVEKERYDELDDITRTLGTSMLGLTIGCARCHDHKYDPIPTRDYYRLLSTFTTTVRSEVDITVPNPTLAAEQAKFDAEHARLTAALARYEKDELPGRLDRWLAEHKTVTAPWQILDLTKLRSAGEATLTKQDDGSVMVTGKNPTQEVLTFTTRTTQKGLTAVRLEALSHPSLVKGGPGRASNGNFALSDFLVTASPLSGKGPAVAIKLVNPRATFEQVGLPVRAAIDDDAYSAWAIDPQFGKDHAAVFEFAQPVGFDGGTELTFTLKFLNNVGHGIARPRLSVTSLPSPVALDGAGMSQVVVEALSQTPSTPAEKTAQRTVLLPWFRTQDPGWVALRKQVDDHQKTAPKPTTFKALICSEGLPPLRLHTQGADFLNETHFLKRGDPNQKDGIVTQSFPQVLTRSPDGEKHWQTAPPPGWRTSYRRKALAAWIIDVDQGAGHLLARVIVNRLWQHHFGQGLVRTPSDFGFQGDKPTHPELLDWLASELVAHNWSLKHVHKLIITSAVYTQGTQADEPRRAIDADNRLLWRQTPRRLEAEAVRDALLSVAGTLDTKMFGPGTLDLNQKRRSIYFFVKRSQLIPFLTLFDAPDGLQGLEQRTTTTVAPQALLLLNNVLVRQCAMDLAWQIVGPEDRPLKDAVEAAYARALGRPPSAEEMRDALAFVEDGLATYRKDGKPDPRKRALTDLCHVLLELNEFVYID